MRAVVLLRVKGGLTKGAAACAALGSVGPKPGGASPLAALKAPVCAVCGASLDM